MRDGNHVNPASKPRSTMATSRPQSRVFSTKCGFSRGFCKLFSPPHVLIPDQSPLSCPWQILAAQPSRFCCIQEETSPGFPSFSRHPRKAPSVTTTTTDCFEDTGGSLCLLWPTPQQLLCLSAAAEKGVVPTSSPGMEPRYEAQTAGDPWERKCCSSYSNPKSALYETESRVCLKPTTFSICTFTLLTCLYIILYSLSGLVLQ